MDNLLTLLLLSKRIEAIPDTFPLDIPGLDALLLLKGGGGSSAWRDPLEGTEYIISQR